MVSQHAVQQKSFDDQRYKSKHNKTFMWQSRRLFGRHHLRVYTRKEARRASASCWCSPAMSSWRGRGETLWHLKCSELNLIYHIVYMLYRCAMIFVSYHVQVAKFHEVPHNNSSFSERPLGCCCLVSRNLEMEFRQQKETTRATNGCKRTVWKCSLQLTKRPLPRHPLVATHTGQRKCQIGSDCRVSPDQNKNESTVMVTSSTNDVRLRCVGRVPMKDISIPLRIFCSQSTGPCNVCTKLPPNDPQSTHTHTHIYIYIYIHVINRYHILRGIGNPHKHI